MCYKKAQDVIPAEIIMLIQQYVDGEYIYIPRKPEKKKPWGDKSQIRQQLSARDAQIFNDHKLGMSKYKLAEKYFLSEKSIERIILKEKRKQVVL
ncbi:MAG: hypothetical protein E7231_09095 [Cellulosilyticum sp.]|nr:hypothetical protein [Cellulosilyticum sp.]